METPIVLPLETHFKSLASCWQHVTEGGHFDPLGKRTGNSTTRPEAPRSFLADTFPRIPGICPLILGTERVLKISNIFSH